VFEYLERSSHSSRKFREGRRGQVVVVWLSGLEVQEKNRNNNNMIYYSQAYKITSVIISLDSRT
jgi:hypothetical protein